MKNHKKTLLLVEDEAVIALTEKLTLEKFGYTVRTVSTGEAAVTAIDSAPQTDLILMDIDLGEGIDGTEAAALILSKHDIPVVFLSSHMEQEIVAKTEKITSYGYVVKNSHITVLDASIKMAFKLFDAKLNEQKKEQALQESERGMKNIVASSPMGIHMYELQAGNKLVFTGSNRAADRMLGIDHTVLYGKTIDEAFPPLVETEIPSRYIQAAVEGKSWKTEQVNYKDSEISGAFEVYAFQTSQNRMAAMFLDITERKQTEEKLLKSEARYRALFDKSNDAIFLVDTAAGTYIDANKAAQILTDRTLSELRTMKTSDLTPDGSKARMNAANTAHEPLVFDDVHYVRPDGTSRLSSLSIIPLGEHRAFGIAHDITDLKLAMKALEESEARSQTYFDKSVVGMALVAMDKKFIDCNEAFCRFTGFDKDEIRKKTIADITWPEDLEKGYAEMKQLLEGTIQSAAIEKRYVTKQGTVVWGELNICLIRKESIGSSYFLASIVDVTDRKKAENSDKQLIAEKEMLLREVHHRIKNNLNTINALLVLQAGSLTDQNAVNALEEAGNRVRSMEILYEKIYAATNFSEVNLGEYLPPLIDDIISNFPNRTAVTIRKSVGSFPVQVKQLQPLGIIVNELLTNIMKYAFAGRNDGTISVSAVLDRNRITVTIEDNGNGMPESVSFDHSTGFGLVLVNGLTKQLGGTIRIERGDGTRIVLEFDK